MIEYKGYIGHFSFDEEKKMFFRKVANSHDFITFQGKSVSELKQSFRNSVEEYITWCKRYRKEKANPSEQKTSEQSEQIKSCKNEKLLKAHLKAIVLFVTIALCAACQRPDI